MTLRAIPLLVLSLILYNAVVWWGGNAPDELLYGKPVIDQATQAVSLQGAELFNITMPNGGVWTFRIGDFILLISLILLGLEVVKATYTRGAGLADQALSVLVFVAFLIEFLLVPMAATSLFFFLTLISGIDVVVGTVVGIRTARRDFGFGPGGESA